MILSFDSSTGKTDLRRQNLCSRVYGINDDPQQENDSVFTTRLVAVFCTFVSYYSGKAGRNLRTGKKMVRTAAGMAYYTDAADMSLKLQ
jgi:hypothetical protein